MRNIIILIFIMASFDALSVCNSPISRINIVGGQVPTSDGYNAVFNDLYARMNTLPGDCINDASLDTEKLADNLASTAKLADASITAAKFAAGVIPVMGRPLRVKAYTSAGTWVKAEDVGVVLFVVIGAGGGSGTSSANGGTSSFGSYCSATGGTRSTSYTLPGEGGEGVRGGVVLAAGTGISLSGSDGSKGFYECSDDGFGGCFTETFRGGAGGRSFGGNFGKGGETSYAGGGGAGGFCAAILPEASISSPVTVTIGAAGANSAHGGPRISTLTAGAGLVVIYEYSK